MVTENEHKHREAREILAKYGVVLKRESLPKIEIQSRDLGEIASYALKQLPLRLRNRRMMIVEDSGLFVEGLHGFPGPYTSDVLATIGIHGLLRLLGNTNPRREAYFESAVALSIPKGKSRLFKGRVWGRISRVPRGREGFGFDPIFIPNGATHSFAEAGETLKNRRSHRAAAMRELAAWLQQ